VQSQVDKGAIWPRFELRPSLDGLSLKVCVLTPEAALVPMLTRCLGTPYGHPCPYRSIEIHQEGFSALAYPSKVS